MRKRRPPATLADALASYLKQSGFSKRLQQAGIIEQWAELVGPQIAAVTAPESVTPDGVLRVRVATAAWANELSLMTPRILARLNAGRTGRVKEIRWVPGRARHQMTEPMAKTDNTAVADGTPQYKAESIQVLKGLEAVRKRPGMYIGSTSENGLHHLVYEVVDNSIDEALAGHCDTINVTIHADNSITVQDNGRGIPVDIHPTEKMPARRARADGAARRRQVRQEHLQGVRRPARRRRLGGERAVRAARGRGGPGRQPAPHGVRARQDGQEARDVGKARGTGTIVRFKPDPEIFTVLEFHYTTLADRLRQLAFLNKGITITIKDEREDQKKEETFFAKGGLSEFVQWLNRNKKPLHPKPIAFSATKDDVEVDLALQYEDGYNENTFTFVNNINTHEGGTHLTGLQVGADPDHQRRGQAARLPEEGRLHPLGRGHPRRAHLRAAREGARSRSSRGRPRPSWATPRSRASSRRW